MRTIYSYIFLAVTALSFVSCENLVDDINENPNQLTLDAVDPGLFMNGAELANVTVQLGYLSRIAGYYSGQIIGVEQVEKNYYEYAVTTGTFDWDGYHDVVAATREIQGRTTENPLYQGMTRVLEANLIGTYASLFGDIPYSEAVSENENPVFDNQIEVFASLQSLLDEAVSYLSDADGYVVTQDYIFDGDAEKWLETAWTLKARFYMYTQEYSLAYAAAQNGISAKSNSMMFTPLNVTGDNSTKNKYYLALSNALVVGTGDSYLMQLLDNSNSSSRNNEKTNETARRAYYTIKSDSPSSNTGIAAELEPQPVVTYQENLLILAEAGARTSGMTVGLTYLNTLREALATGVFFNSSVSGMTMQYDDYTADDFASGGMENEDGIEPLRALLREIVEERYVSGFTTFMPFDDSRRLEDSESDIAVPFPLNTATATQNVQRFLYPADELESNSNSPADPGLYSKTRVNSL